MLNAGEKTGRPRKLWLLTAREPQGRECVRALVVRANHEKDARRVAGGKAGKEGSEFWHDQSRADCVRLTQTGEPCVLIRDLDESSPSVNSRPCPECGRDASLHGKGTPGFGCDMTYGRRGWRQLGVYDG